MAIPPELEIRQYASRHHFTIASLDRTDTRMTVIFGDEEEDDELEGFLDEMVEHYSKRSGIDVNKHFVSIVFIRQEAPNVQTKEE